jgi:hypothetical protein
LGKLRRKLPTSERVAHRRPAMSNGSSSWNA